MNFQLPPRLLNEKGEKRRVGFELEFGGLDLGECAKILIRLFGGEVSVRSEYVLEVKTPLGRFELEADSAFLKEKTYEKYLGMMGIKPQDPISQNINSMLGMLAGTLIPFEIATPPLVIDDLEPVEKIRAELQKHSAQGTKAAVLNAFGMQFNPEVPDTSAETLLGYLRGFFLLFDWLYEESEIPVSRKVAPFINNFPEEYIQLVLEPSYDPTLHELMTDYLTHNPTRNRPLDLLPLFADIDKALVFSYPVETDLIKPRPTFHYRLPNSMVDDPSWQIANEWNKWVMIERLAADPSRLFRMTDDFFDTREDNILFVHSKWAKKTREWLHV